MTTFNTTHDYDRYWSNSAQFFQPCDRLTGVELEPFKQFGAQIHEDIAAEFEQTMNIAIGEKEAAEERFEELGDKFSELKKALREAVSESDPAIIKYEILKILDAE